ncbi:MAG: betaine/proline/choline family ABC transporter ATP-binding protein [Syntrophaceticus sp.]|nr:betaine/proline/choline family ABC transporter ATP-binding protein [Syntrophaceticus sp.]MDD3314342.1 betaine/proline/choline family ABC transporter ATP-binding protein [Syntrophaceticus sp.]MDD4359147.1 betaine/proline/choline family ABC transporter ATP-binding protein [Syntrophaceticus sp.]MDD4782838.1 betaine/proline/choline family ABC transporter ATP-binding protein [Syntrophaceticus sp.]
MTETSSNADTLLEVKGLWKVFDNNNGNKRSSQVDYDSQDTAVINSLQENGAVLAIRDVSFKVRRGEVFVIMGLSGSGKSTLIRCIPRLIEPTQGEIKVNGQNVLQMDENQLIEFRRHETAMVFQHYGLLPHRNVIENVAFGLKLRGVPLKERTERARYVISRVGLEDWETHYPSQLSGGMRQRVGIARALVQKSDLLLMDEPFSGLDPLIRREMQDRLIRLQDEEKKTIVFVTHDLSEAARLGSRMAVMREGEFVQQDTPDEIINNPADEYVERFVFDERDILSNSKHGSTYKKNKKSRSSQVHNKNQAKNKAAAALAVAERR